MLFAIGATSQSVDVRIYDDNAAEEWRAIDGYRGYEVSSLGRIRSYLRRVGYGSGGGCHSVIGEAPRVLKTNPNTEGYPCVCLSRDGKQFKKTIHGLVLQAFVGPRPQGYEACHGPNGRGDSSLANLSWGTKRKNNFDDKLRDGTHARGTRQKNAKLNDDQVRLIRRLLQDPTVTQRSLAARFGVHKSQISLIHTRKEWAWLEDGPIIAEAK